MAEVSGREGGRVLYVVSTWVPEDELAAWNRWHTAVHVPEVVAQPQIRRARKYRVVSEDRAAAWTPQYVTVYELDSLQDWESYRRSPAAAALRKDYEEQYGTMGKIARQVLIEEADIVADA